MVERSGGGSRHGAMLGKDRLCDQVDPARAMTRLPTYFLSHGGGPWPFLSGPIRSHFAGLEASIKAMPRQLGELPHAILVISAHWAEPEFAVSSSPTPPMIYDYGGFPEHTYHVSYPAPGSPELADRMQALLKAGGMACRRDPERGFDHGTISVMQPLRPEADIPVVQLSLKIGFDPRAHFEAGQLLAPLRDEGVLILGSGMSYHNLRRMDPAAGEPSRTFDAWLQETLASRSQAERAERLVRWSEAPAARMAHPSEDHLLPLMVAAGAAENDTGTCVFHEDKFLGTVAVSSFCFGGSEVP